MDFKSLELLDEEKCTLLASKDSEVKKIVEIILTSSLGTAVPK